MRFFYETNHLADDGEFGLTQIYDVQKNQELLGNSEEQTQEPGPLKVEHDIQQVGGTYLENTGGVNEPSPSVEQEENNGTHDSQVTT